MTITEVLELLQSTGGYGLAAFMFYLYKQEVAERQRYRDQFEAVLNDLPKLTQAMDKLTNEVERATLHQIGAGPRQ